MPTLRNVTSRESTNPSEAAMRTVSPRPLDASLLLHGRDMLCFSHDWTGDPLSKTHLMRQLSRDNRILWVNSIGYRTPTVCKRDLSRAWRKLTSAFEPIREVEPNIFVLNPIAVPVYNATGQTLNRWLLRRQVLGAMEDLHFQRPINWVFNPAAAVVAGTLGEDLILYYCVDEYTAFSGVQRAHLAAMENRLRTLADMVVVSAEPLLQSKSAANGHTLLIRHGVDFEHFARTLSPDTLPAPELAGLPRPILGYFGLIAEDWVDLPLLEHVARSFPEASLVLLGKVMMDVSSLARHRNVHLLGRKPYSELPRYCKSFDVALIPFPISEVTLHANPLKAREYLAAGLPVVSTAIPEVTVLPHCRVARSEVEFVNQVMEALQSSGPSETRSASMRSETWAARLDELRRYMAAHTIVGKSERQLAQGA